MTRITRKDAPRQGGGGYYDPPAPPAGPTLPEGRMRRLNVPANAVATLRALWEETDPAVQEGFVATLGAMGDDEFVAWADGYAVPDGTVDDVTGWVDSSNDPITAAEAALALESRAETPRKTLLAALDARIRAADA